MDLRIWFLVISIISTIFIFSTMTTVHNDYYHSIRLNKLITDILNDQDLNMQLHLDNVTFTTTTIIDKKIYKNYGFCKCKIHEVKSQKPEQLIGAFNELKSIDPFTNLSTIQTIKLRNPNIPIDLVTSKRHCEQMPFLTEIFFSGSDWQFIPKFFGHELYLYSAFHDNRPMTVIRPSLLVIVMSPSVIESPKLGFCQLWFGSTTPSMWTDVISVRRIHYAGFSKNMLMPYLLTCAIPKSVNNEVVAVSITSDKCENPSNILKVVGSDQNDTATIHLNNFNFMNEKNATYQDNSLFDVGVCTPAMFFYQNDHSKYLIEWFQIMMGIGVKKVFIYRTILHPNVDKVISYYESIGFVEVTTFSFPSRYIENPSLRRIWTLMERSKIFSLENVYFTDCILRNMYKYRYIAHWDFDEIPFMGKFKEVSELLKSIYHNMKINSKNDFKSLPAAQSLQWAYFYENFPPGPKMMDLSENFNLLRHNQRLKKHVPKLTPGVFKSIYDTSLATGVYSHGVLFCNNGPCQKNVMVVHSSIAYLGHIRKYCDKKCQNGSQIIPVNYYIQLKSFIVKSSLQIFELLNL